MGEVKRVDKNEPERGWVLVVDDSEDAREFIQVCLEGNGYGVITAANGNEAFRVLLDRPSPKAILLDLLMPEMDGFEFLNLMRTYRRLARIPVIVISAVKAAKCDGCAGHLHKPIREGELLQSLEAATAF